MRSAKSCLIPGTQFYPRSNFARILTTRLVILPAPSAVGFSPKETRLLERDHREGKSGDPVKFQRNYVLGRPRRKILLVEDQSQVRQSTTLILENAGFDVFSAEYASEALRIFRETPGIEVVISDLELPGASGLQLREALRNEAPWISVLLTTGHICEQDIESAEMLTYFLPKPYAARALVSKLEEILTPLVMAKAAAQAG